MDSDDRRYGYTKEEYGIFKGYAWRYLVMFSLLYMTMYCCRLNLSNASASMMAGLDWTTSDIGILTSTLFWTYGLGQLVNGRLSEIAGPSRFVMCGVALSIVCNVVMGLQSSLVVMAVVWGINGYFQSMSWSPGIALLTKWWPGESRGFATGFVHAASGFGQAVATLGVAAAFTLAPDMGWRAAFFVPAIVPLVVLVLFKVIARAEPARVGLAEYRESRTDLAQAEQEMAALKAEHGALYPYKYVFSNKRFFVWLFVSFASGLARYGLLTWIPLYFIQRFGMDVTSGLIQSLVLPVGMGVGTFVIPWATDKWCPSNRLAAVLVSAIVSAAAVAVLFLADPTSFEGLVLTEVALFVAGFTVYGINGATSTFATDIGGRVFAGTATGVLNCAAYMGAAIQSLVYGYLLMAGDWGAVFASIVAVCILVAVVSLVSTRSKAHADT